MLESLADVGGFVVGALVVAPWVGYLGVVLLGLAVGSFLNVVIYRAVKEILSPQPSGLPLLALLWGASHCGHCQTRLRWYNMVPVLSWVVALGQCKYCGAKVSAQYPIVEALTAVMFALLAWRYGWTMTTLGLMLMSAILLSLSVIDLRTFYLPDGLNHLLVWSGVLFALMDWGLIGLEASVIAAMAGWAFLWSVNWVFRFLRGHDGLGSGDAVLLAGLGAWLGLSNISMVILWASVLSLLMLPVVRALHRRWALLDDSNPPGALPLGPGLSVGGYLVAVGLTIFKNF